MAEIWQRASDRVSVTEAANRIDQALAWRPLEQGEDFYGDRILVVPPLAVTYTVSEPDVSVQILQVWNQSTTAL